MSLRTRTVEKNVLELPAKIEKCGPCPSPLWTSGGFQIITSSVPSVSTAILLLCTVYSKFLLCLRPISLEEKHETFIASVKKLDMLAATKVKMSRSEHEHIRNFLHKMCN